MTTRTVTAMFNSRAEAERAVQQLMSQLGLDRAMVRTSPETGMTDTGYDRSRPYEETGFWASLKDLFLPDEDRYAYAEGMRRGNVLVSATVDENKVDQAADILEQAGAADLDQQEASWRQSGWTGYDATAAATARRAYGGTATGAAMTGTAGTAATTAATPRAAAQAGQDETIQVVEERLVVGKREVDRGRVRVRSYVVERPVEEQVSLHEERVDVERHRVDRPVTAADADLFKERVIEATATSEEAVVGKEARVVEEIAVHKQAADRTETVRDTLRRTEVEVEDNATGAGSAAADRMVRPTPGAPVTGKSGSGTGVGAAVDKTLGTNMTGTNPGANAPDGTPGNPPGTMASRAVDKTLGTNISGANPTRKP